MQDIPVLIIGEAFDGPPEAVLPITSADQAFRLYGGYHYERTNIASGDTGYELSITPWDNEVKSFQEDSDGLLSPKQLWEFSVNGNFLTWNRYGDALSNVVFQALRVPGPRSLLQGVLAALDYQNPVYVMRVDNSTSAQSATSGGFYFRARYPGAKYNGTTIVVSGDRVSITPAAGCGASVSNRQFTSDFTFTEWLQTENTRGREQFYLHGPRSQTSFTIPTATYVLTGGTNGTLNGDRATAIIEDYDFRGIEVVCPVGVPSIELSGAGFFSALKDLVYPTIAVVQAVPSGAALSGIINTDRQVVSVAFQVDYESGQSRQRTYDAAPLVAGLIGSTRFNITMAQLSQGPPTPRYTQTELHALTSGGHLTAFRSISKNWALWQCQTGDPRWSVSCMRAFQQVVREVFIACDDIIGKNFVDLTSIEDKIRTALGRVTTGEIVDWAVDLKGDILYIDITFRPNGELRTVSARVNIGRQQFPLT